MGPGYRATWPSELHFACNSISTAPRRRTSNHSRPRTREHRAHYKRHRRFAITTGARGQPTTTNIYIRQCLIRLHYFAFYLRDIDLHSFDFTRNIFFIDHNIRHSLIFIRPCNIHQRSTSIFFEHPYDFQHFYVCLGRTHRCLVVRANRRLHFIRTNFYLELRHQLERNFNPKPYPDR